MKKLLKWKTIIRIFFWGFIASPFLTYLFTPNLLGSVGKPSEQERRVKAIVNAQEEFYIRNARFSNSLEDLKLPPQESNRFQYQIEPNNEEAYIITIDIDNEYSRGYASK